MQKNTDRPLALGLTVLGAAARLIPHLPNFSPVGSFSLFAGGKIRGWQAYLLPVVLMAITDPFLGGYSSATPWVYASLMINVWIGSRLCRKATALRVGSAAGLGSLQFFLITNFAVWLSFPTSYPHTLAGLATCYAAGLPYYGRTLAGDLVYTGVLFGLYAWLSNTLARRVEATAHAA